MNENLSEAVEAFVYLVDDDAAVRDALSLLIRSIGLKVKAYGDPTAFLQDLTGAEAGCLVLDIRMPSISGFGVQERLVASGCNLPVILITGHGDVAQCRRAFQNGAVDFLTKPIDEQALIECLQKAMREDEARRAERRRVKETRAKLARLSARECAVFDLICDGLPNKLVADQLHLSLRTVEAYRATVMEKLSATSIADLVRMKLIGSGGQNFIP